ncbi:type I polyketide synthase [Aspergillus fijiensis CBS 313.89]|uniref:Polyketide synthase module n=1 Tax=Aspergillus fijiensis CBS 313.89 TaxID=1448319 RepID=A0A8G1RQQ9_9EURO|nr:polyketide synthase module [Aspergillus fijiensis CBS 313.89]RAK76583.1 polyketide synthase module [Aspergillus fijiensis CBS 313.89]
MHSQAPSIPPPPPIPIAVLGVSCRLPGEVRTPAEFWRFCCQARSAWSPISPASRFDPGAYYHPNPDRAGTTHAQGGHFLSEDLARFDASFFGMTEEEAMATDPQQRLMLECAYEGLENANLVRRLYSSRLGDGERVGVFAAGSASDYELHSFRDLQSTTSFQVSGCAASFLSNRISHFFNFTGPSVTIDTACSSSLSALHLACQSLRSGECTHALVGGCHLNLTPDSFISFSLSRLFSDSGRCYPFDSRGESGYGRGEGAGCVVLKRLDDAIRDGDPIRAVVMNTGMNQDGHTQGVGVPNSAAQRTLMEDLYRAARINPLEVGYVEAHGTGTRVGDPLEARALYEFFGRGRTEPLWIGSIKSNFGHAEGASGVISLIKTVLMLEKDFILPNCDFQTARSDIPLEEWNLQVPTRLVAWPEGKPYASVNNFGLGGTNAHVILTKAPARNGNCLSMIESHNSKRHPQRGPLRFFTLSGHDSTAVSRQAQTLARYVEQHPLAYDSHFMDSVAHTLSKRSLNMPWRYAVSARSATTLVNRLAANTVRPRRAREPPVIGFIFTGQGSQWHAMARGLSEIYPVFEKAIIEAEAHLAAMGADFSLTEELSRDEQTCQFSRPSIGQAASTAIQIALTNLLRSWSIHPTAVIGHSSGEIAASYAAGVFNLQDAISLAYYRGLAAESLRNRFPDAKGGMLVIGATLDEVERLIEEVTHGRVSVACLNSPHSITIAGSIEGIAQAQEIATKRSLFNRRLAVDVGYHCFQMELVASEYERRITKVKPSQSTTAFYSSTRSCRLDGLELQYQYWLESFVSPTKFSDGLFSLLSEGTSQPQISCLIEVGPSATLEGPVKDILQSLSNGSKVEYFPTLRRRHDAGEMVHDLAASLFSRGVPIDVCAVNHREPSMANLPDTLQDFPPYSWDHSKRFWRKSRVAENVLRPQAPRHDLIGLRLAEGNDLEPQWRVLLRADDHPWIRQHRFQNKNLFPFAGFVAMAIEAALQEAMQHRTSYDDVSLAEISVGKGLLVPDSVPVEVVISLRPRPEGSTQSSSAWKEFRVMSWAEERGWEENCRGLISVQSTVSNPVNGARLSADRAGLFARSLSDIGDPCRSVVDRDYLYEELRRWGVDYGTLFRGLHDCTSGGGRGKAMVLVPDVVAAMPHNHATDTQIHPVTLDIIFQVIWLTLGAGTNGLHGASLPTFIKSITIQRQGKTKSGDKLEIFGSRSERTLAKQASEHNVWACCDGNSAPIVQIEGLVMTPVQDSVPLPVTTRAERELVYALRNVPTLDLMTQQQFNRHLRPDEPASMAQSQKARILAQGSAWCLANIRPLVPSKMHTKALETLLQPLDLQEKPPAIDMLDSLGPSGLVLSKLCDKIPQALQGELDLPSLIDKHGGLGEYTLDLPSLHQVYKAAAEAIDILASQSPSLSILEVGSITCGPASQILQRLGGGPTGRSARFSSYVRAMPRTSLFSWSGQKLKDWGNLVGHMPVARPGDVPLQASPTVNYDVVILCSNPSSEHCIIQSLTQARMLLKPSGKLMIVEETMAHLLSPPLYLLSISGDKKHISPPKSSDEWRGVLQDSGFSGVDLAYNPAELSSAESATIILSTAIDSSKGLAGRSVTIVVPPNLQWFPLSDLVTMVESMTGRAPRIQTVSDDTPIEDLCIFLGAVESPLLSQLTPHLYKCLHRVLTSSRALLWVLQRSDNDAAGSMATGLARTIRSESGSCVITLDTDFSSNTPAGDVIDPITRVMQKAFVQDTVDGMDQEYVYRDGVITVPRIYPDEAMNREIYRNENETRITGQSFHQHDRPLKLAIEEFGDLSSLHFQDDLSLDDPLGQDDVEIEVHFVGLNFKDVMHANNQIHVPGGFGIECSGIVVGIGRQVSRFQIGDRVCAISEGSFANRVRCRASSAWCIPDAMTLDVAATIPVVFCTALFSLYRVAKLTKGESILIHAGAGGVGQAAIVLAQARGAHVYATVGSPEKKAFLIERYKLREDDIFFSRDVSFAESVRLATGGRGVDVVLNSLAGDALRSSLTCLAPFGRFIELGKKDIMSNSYLQLAPFDLNISFTSVDLSVFSKDRPELLQSVFAEVFDLFQQGVVKPTSLSSTKYDLANIESAFQMLQSGRSMGKLVVDLENKDAEVKAVTRNLRKAGLSPEHTYVVIGGSGGLGRSILTWFADQGAQYLVAVYTRDSSLEKMQTLVTELSSRGVVIQPFKCDIGHESQVAALFDQGIRDLPPVAGVVHSAMVLRDVLFENMTFEDYEAVIRPKVHGVLNLHAALEKCNAPLEFFVALSSVAGIVGNKGQAAYSAASTFLDSFSYLQTARGRPFTSIDLAPVWDTGVLAGDAHKRQQVQATFAHNGINQAELVRLLECAIFQKPQADGKDTTAPRHHILTGLAVPADANARNQMEWPKDPKFAFLVAGSSSTASASSTERSRADPTVDAKASPKSLTEVLAAVSSRTDAQEAIETALVQKLSAVVMCPVEDIDRAKSIAVCGVDSLSAIGIRKWIVRELDAPLSLFEIMNSPSVRELAGLCLEKARLRCLVELGGGSR